MYDIVNKNQNLTLPVVAIDVNSVSLATNRIFNKTDNIYNVYTGKNNSSIAMPVPIDITLSMSILGRYMQDIEQIITNFVSYTDPYIIISWKEPSAVDGLVREIRSEVLWSGNITFNTPTDISYNEKFRVVCDTSFTIKGWIFKNKNTVATPIYFIDINTHDLSKYTDLYYNGLTGLDINVETFNLSGIPAITNIFYGNTGLPVDMPSTFNVNKQLSANNIIIMYGDNYSFTDNVFLSSNSPITTNLILTTFNTEYTGTATGYIIPSAFYTLNTNNILTLQLPPLTGSGKFDILIKNSAGWRSTHNLSACNFQIT